MPTHTTTSPPPPPARPVTPPLPAARKDEWMRLEEQKRQDLLETGCDEALRISTVGGLKDSLHEMIDRFRVRELPHLVQQLNPTLEHLQSFTAAITSASQYEPVACLVWGGIQAVVESACIVSCMTQDVVDLIVELNTTLPQFDSYLALFPGKHELQWALQDIFDCFLGYCITAAQYFRRGYSRNFLTNLFSSALTSTLRDNHAKIKRHIKAFHDAAEFIHRENVRRQHLEITRKLGDNPIELPSDPGTTVDMGDSRFPVTTVTMFRNFTFTGRSDILKRARDTLHPSADEDQEADQRLEAEHHMKKKYGPACCLIHGLAGIGKTQIALEYTYLYRDEYDATFWLEAEHDWTLASSYAQMAFKLGLVDEDDGAGTDGDKKQNIAIQKARDWLQNTERKWLLVFDNVEDPTDLNAYMPTESNVRGAVIITTQKPITYSLTEVFGAIQVKPFTRDDAAALLFKYLQKEPTDEREEDVARDLSDMVEGLPLAIATIGGYVNQSESNLAEFIKTLKHSSNAWTASAVGPVRQYGKNLETVFDIALSELSENATGLVNILAFLNPDHIPEALFTTAFEKRTLDFLRDKADLIEIVRELRARQLVRRDTSGPEPYLSIHRTVQWNVLLQLSKDGTHRWEMFQKAFRVVKDVLPDDSPFVRPAPGQWLRYQRYGPHILSLRTHCLWPDPPIELPVNFAEVISDMGTFMWHAGKFSEGQEALETAVEIMDDNGVTAEQGMRAKVFTMLGIMSSFEGVSEREKSFRLRFDARDARVKAFEAIPAKKVTREDEIQLTVTESDMAYAFVQEEKFKEAADVWPPVLEKYHAWGTDDEYPYQYSQYYQVMAVCEMAFGNPIKSIELITQCCDLLVRASEIMHPMTQLMRFVAGILTWHAGEKEQALEIHESVLTARRKVTGEFSEFTLESYSTCAYLLAEAGQYQKASEYLEKCLERRKRNYWNEEGVGRAQYRYAQVLEELGEKEKAESYADAARMTRERFMKEYAYYLPDTGDDEAVFDQMVSIWSGRFTGKMRQVKPELPDAPDSRKLDESVVKLEGEFANLGENKPVFTKPGET